MVVWVHPIQNHFGHCWGVKIHPSLFSDKCARTVWAQSGRTIERGPSYWPLWCTSNNRFDGAFDDDNDDNNEDDDYDEENEYEDLAIIILISQINLDSKSSMDIQIEQKSALKLWVKGPHNHEHWLNTVLNKVLKKCITQRPPKIMINTWTSDHPSQSKTSSKSWRMCYLNKCWLLLIAADWLIADW